MVTVYIIIHTLVGGSQLVSVLAGLAGAFIHIEEHSGAQEDTTVVTAMVIIVGTGMDIIGDIPEVPGLVMLRDQETQMFIKTAQQV